MPIDIEIFGQLIQAGEPRRRTLQLEEPSTARSLAQTLGLDEATIWMVTIDGGQGNLDDVVRSGSRLCFFPYLSGG